jgi:ADP-heptose:LPS heptosyltransferase
MRVQHRAPPRAHPAADLAASPDWTVMDRILLVRPDNLGDVVMRTPALRALRAAAPQARLDMFVSPAGSALRPLLADLDGLVTVAPSWQQVATDATPGRLAAAEFALVDLLAGRGYDAAVVFTSPTQSPWPAVHAAMLAGVRVRVAQSAEFGGAVASHWVTPPPEGTHQVDRCLHLLAAVGVTPLGRRPALHVPESGRGLADDALRGAGRSAGDAFAVLAPGASCSSRRYPAAGFARVARQLAAAGLPVLVTGTANEADLVAGVVDGAGHRGVRTLPVLPVEGLAGVIEQAAVAVTNNSGGMHLADALGTPVVVAWAGTEPVGVMGPRAVPSVLLGRTVPCSPCRQFRCPYAHECLDFDPALLATAALDLVALDLVGSIGDQNSDDQNSDDQNREESRCRTPRLTEPAPAR